MKLMTNNNNGMATNVQIAGNTLYEVKSFKYLGAIISEECSKPKVFAEMAQATVALSKMVWSYHTTIKDPSYSFSRDINLPVCMRNLDTQRRSSTQNTSNGDEMLPKTPQHIVHPPQNDFGSTINFSVKSVYVSIIHILTTCCVWKLCLSMHCCSCIYSA